MEKILFFAQKAIVQKENKVLTIRYSQESKNLAGKLGFPGGRMEFGELPTEQLRREIKEETGYVDIEVGSPVAISHWFVKKGQGDAKEAKDADLQIVAVFVACKLISEKNEGVSQEEDEYIEGVEWWDPQELLDSGEFNSHEVEPLIKFINNYE